jgi:hypothetical protein
VARLGGDQDFRHRFACEGGMTLVAYKSVARCLPFSLLRRTALPSDPKLIMSTYKPSEVGCQSPARRPFANADHSSP